MWSTVPPCQSRECLQNNSSVRDAVKLLLIPAAKPNYYSS